MLVLTSGDCGVAPIEASPSAKQGTREVTAQRVALDGTVTDEGKRIINGTEASPGEYPYQVFLTNTEGLFACGASIIKRSWLLTGAHCMEPFQG